MNEETYVLYYKKFVGLLGLIITISYILKMLASGINILVKQNNANKEQIKEILKRHVTQAINLLDALNLTDKDIENLFNKFKFIVDIMEVREKLNLIYADLTFENSEIHTILDKIAEKLNISDLNLILRHVKMNDKLIKEIQSMFLENLIP